MASWRPHRGRVGRGQRPGPCRRRGRRGRGLAAGIGRLKAAEGPRRREIMSDRKENGPRRAPGEPWKPLDIDRLLAAAQRRPLSRRKFLGLAAYGTAAAWLAACSKNVSPRGKTGG